jgi:fibronectin type 3 domain-containing protein
MRYMGWRILLTIGTILVFTPQFPLMSDGSTGIEEIDPDRISDPVIPSDPGAGVFIENRGQWDPSILFVASTSYGKIALAKDGIYHQLVTWEKVASEHPYEPSKDRVKDSCVVKILFEGGSPMSVLGIDPVDTMYNFFLGNDPTKWASGLRGYDSVLYSEVWPGISIRYYHKEGCLKYDIILSPGADPDAIGFNVNGAESVCISDGLIIITTSISMAITDSPPIASYLGGNRIRAAFRLDGTIYGFHLEPYDRSREVVIDPSYNVDAFSFSTYIGGSFLEESSKMDVDAAGDIYLTGWTRSGDFPVSQNCYQPNKNGWMNSFVFKLDKTGKSRLYATYIGGSSSDEGTDIKIDASGNAYIAGNTNSVDFPHSDGAYCETLSGGNDYFLCYLNKTGGSLTYSTYLGGSQDDFDPSIDLDPDGNIYLTARTLSIDFPLTSDAFQDTLTNPGTYYDLTIVKFNLSTMSLVYSTFLGGSDSDTPNSIIYESGSLYIVGYTPSSDFNTTDKAYQKVIQSGADAFVLAFDIKAGILEYSTYFGGAGFECFNDLRLDSNGDVVACGYCYSSDMPTTPGALDSTRGGFMDGIVVCIGSKGTSLVFSTYFGGDGDEKLYGIDLDTLGNIHITGSVTGVKDKMMNGCLQEEPGGSGYEAFYVEIKNNASAILYSTYLGGSSEDEGFDIYFDQVASEPIIMGITLSSDFPVKNGSYDTIAIGGYSQRDAFVSKFTLVRLPTSPTNITAAAGDSFVELSWKITSDYAGVTVNYTIWRGIAANKTDLIVGTTLDLTYNDSEVENGITYFYAIKARNRAGSGPFSNVVSARPASVPSPPRDLKVVSVGDESVQLSWKIPENTGGKGIAISSYRIYRNSVGGSAPCIIPVTTTTYQDQNVLNGVNYTYRLTAVNEIGESMPSYPVYAVPRTVPTNVRDLRAESGDGFIHLYWTAPESDGGSPILNYLITRQAAHKTDITVEPDTLEYNDTGLANGQKYTYGMKAENVAGFGPTSDTVGGTPTGRPTVPTEFRVESHPSSATLSWGPSEYDGGSPLKCYNIYRKEGEGAWGMVQAIDCIQSEFTDEDLLNGQIYFYRITALNLADKESDPTEEREVLPLDYPGPVVQLKAMAGDGFVIVSWQEPLNDGGTEMLGYKVFRGSVPTFFGQPSVIESTSFNDTSVTNGNTYYYRVKAFNSLGDGEGTDSEGVMPCGRPSAPRSIVLVSGDGYVDISWENPETDGGLPINEVRIYRGRENSEAIPIHETPFSQGTYRDESAENGVRYSYSLSARNAKGEGPKSELLNITPLGKPSAPMNIQTNFLSASSIEITWNAPETTGGSPLLNYNIYRSIDTGSWIKIAEVAGDQTKYIDDGLEPGKIYRYRISAVNALGEGPQIDSEPIQIKDEKALGAIFFILPIVLILLLIIGIAIFFIARKKKVGTIDKVESNEEGIAPETVPDPTAGMDAEKSDPIEPSVEPVPIVAVPDPTSGPTPIPEPTIHEDGSDPTVQ